MTHSRLFLLPPHRYFLVSVLLASLFLFFPLLSSMLECSRALSLDFSISTHSLGDLICFQGLEIILSSPEYVPNRPSDFCFRGPMCISHRPPGAASFLLLVSGQNLGLILFSSLVHSTFGPVTNPASSPSKYIQSCTA